MFVGGPDVARWVAMHIPGCERGWDNCQAIGVLDNERLIGGIVYHNWSPETGVIELSAAATTPRWMSRDRLKVLFGYPFDELGCRMIVMRVAEGNARMRSIGRRLGCREYSIDDLRAEGEAEIVLTLTRAAWREFTGDAYGQAESANAA